MLGTHNSITYLKPKRWWMYPFRFMARCQSMSIEEQYKYGIRHFDLRIAFNKEGSPEFRHGIITYKGDVCKILEYLNTRQESVYCKFWLELTRESKEQEKLFAYYCEIFEKHYKNISFYGGQNKKGKIIYQFKNKEPEHKACFASLQPPCIDDLWPWLYARIHNRKAKKLYKKQLLILDFIEL